MATNLHLPTQLQSGSTKLLQTSQFWPSIIYLFFSFPAARHTHQTLIKILSFLHSDQQDSRGGAQTHIFVLCVRQNERAGAHFKSLNKKCSVSSWSPSTYWHSSCAKCGSPGEGCARDALQGVSRELGVPFWGARGKKQQSECRRLLPFPEEPLEPSQHHQWLGADGQAVQTLTCEYFPLCCFSVSLICVNLWHKDFLSSNVKISSSLCWWLCLCYSNPEGCQAWMYRYAPFPVSSSRAQGFAVLPLSVCSYKSQPGWSCSISSCCIF